MRNTKQFLENKIESLLIVDRITIDPDTKKEAGILLGTYKMLYKTKYGKQYK